jgi:hypothetical protein
MPTKYANTSMNNNCYICSIIKWYVQSQRRRKLKENLFNKRRLIILNEDTFEETFSLKLTLMNVFLVASVEQF